MNRKTTCIALFAGLAAATSAAQISTFEPGNVNSTVPAGSLSGTAAVRSMGDDLARIAAENNTTPEALAAWFMADRSLYLTPSGRLLNVCPPAPEGEDEPATAGRIFDEDIPLDDFMDLESIPGANKTVYLDVDGHFSTGNSWGHSINFPAYNTQGSSATFSDAEKSDIIEHWKEVAEDFAPFNINVTTKDPGLAALVRSGGSDQQFGIRVVMTQATSGFGNGIGGVAFLNSFNDSIDNPCFAFNKGLGAGPMTVSHEAGHTFGLQHDGLGGSEYHPGSSGSGPRWGPIMGAPFGDELVQWSSGDYPNATSGQNDFNVITSSSNGVSLLPDDHINDIFSGTPISLDTPVEGVINNATDVDSFQITIPSAGDYNISVLNATRGPNLDVMFTVYGQNPLTIEGETNPNGTADAEAVYSLDAGDYVIVIDGTFENKTNGPVSDYGSVGGFQLTVTEVVPPQPFAITFPSGLPTDLTEGQPTTITVDIDPGDDGPILPGSTLLFYGFDVVGQPFLPVVLVNTTGTTWTADIPAADCGQTASFYVTATNDALTTFNSPSNPALPYTAVVTDCLTADCVADTNGDGSLSPADFNAWVIAFNSQAPECDQNGDGLCTPADFNAWIVNFNAGCP